MFFNFFELIKKWIFFLIFDIEIEESTVINTDQQKDIGQEDNLVLSYKKVINWIIIIITVSFLFMNYNNDTINIDYLNSLLNELGLIVSWDLYIDIFKNVQHLLNNLDNKNSLLVLKEIHKFFLTESGYVKNPAEFNRIMSEIIKIFSNKE